MSISSFSDFALTRSEMKSIIGGSCYVRGDGTYVTQYTGEGAAAAAEKAAIAAGTNWCCDSCANAQWCYLYGDFYCN